jgi:hypothetical protein
MSDFIIDVLLISIGLSIIIFMFFVVRLSILLKQSLKEMIIILNDFIELFKSLLITNKKIK